MSLAMALLQSILELPSLRQYGGLTMAMTPRSEPSTSGASLLPPGLWSAT